MSDILAGIDDVLDNWHGSRDAMHWRAGPTPEQASAALRHMTQTIAPVLASITAQIQNMTRALEPMARALAALQLTPEPRITLDARYQQRQKNRRRRR